MAQRSPTNPRYQKHTKPSGKTRKSAASAKPKRQSSSPAEKSSSESSSKPAPPPLPPELRPWRIAWWALLLTGMVAALGAFLLRNQPEMQAVGTGLLVVAYACIFGGLVIDWLKVRPARRAAMEGRTASSGKSKDGAEKDSAQPETTDDSDE